MLALRGTQKLPGQATSAGRGQKEPFLGKEGKAAHSICTGVLEPSPNSIQSGLLSSRLSPSRPPDCARLSFLDQMAILTTEYPSGKAEGAVVKSVDLNQTPGFGIPQS